MTATQAPKDTALRDVRVKALVWQQSAIKGWNGDYHTVPTGYTVRCADENGWKWAGPGGFGYENSPSSAQAAAQADYERRILTALEPSTALVQSNRERDQAREALATDLDPIAYSSGFEAGGRIERERANFLEDQLEKLRGALADVKREHRRQIFDIEGQTRFLRNHVERAAELADDADIRETKQAAALILGVLDRRAGQPDAWSGEPSAVLSSLPPSPSKEEGE